MSENKKIKGATAVTYEDINFRSKFEERVYKKLLSLGYNPEYELEHFVLWEGFRPQKEYYYNGIPENTKKKDHLTGKMTVLTDKPEALQSWRYTPDFLLRMNGFAFYVEAKGHPNDLWPYKKKLFLKAIDDIPNTYFFEVRSIKGLLASLEVMKKISKQNG